MAQSSFAYRAIQEDDGLPALGKGNANIPFAD